VAKVIECVGARYEVRGVEAVYGRHPRASRPNATATGDRLSQLLVPTGSSDRIVLVSTQRGKR